MEKPLITIIIAIYNMEKYLSRCIESVLNQTYKNLEIILVDDGSIDNSLEICKTYQIRDSRIKVFSKENSGQAGARNLALDRANGAYIGFVDSDDWIDPAMYDTLYSLLINNQASIAQCAWSVVTPQGKIKVNNDMFLESYTSEEALEVLIDIKEGVLNTSVCCKLFDKQVVNSVRFPLVRAYEDDEFVFRTVAISNRIVCSSIPMYYYLNRENSTMTSAFNINKLALLTVQENICNLIKFRLPNAFNICQKYLCSKQFYMLYCLSQASNIDSKGIEFEKIYNKIMHSYNIYIKNPVIGRNKYILFCMKYMPRKIWIFVLKMFFLIKKI